MGKKLKAGSIAWEEERRRDPEYVRATILRLAREAEGGSKQSVEFLLGWLEQYPDMRSLVHQLDDLATKVENVWAAHEGGPDPLARKAITDEIAALKAELLGPAPSVTDKIMAGTVVVAHLAFQRAAVTVAQPTPHPEVRLARARLLTAAQRRLQEAIRGWELYSGKKVKGLRAKGNLKLFAPAAG